MEGIALDMSWSLVLINLRRRKPKHLQFSKFFPRFWEIYVPSIAEAPTPSTKRKGKRGGEEEKRYRGGEDKRERDKEKRR